MDRPENTRRALMAAVRREVARCPFHAFLGIEVVEADDRTTALRLPFKPELGLAHDEHPAFHGGALASLCDITAHAAVAARAGGVTPTIDLRIDFLQPAHGEYVLAQATILRAGRSIARADVSITNPAGEVVATARGAFSTRGASQTR
jgi:uncharacterized protein (TIGR00369 family)